MHAIALSQLLHKRFAVIFPLTSWAQLFEGRLAVNPGLNVTRVSFSYVQNRFLG